SPRPAYFEMLRATSEIAVAIMVTSVSEKVRRVASSRPAWRAVTMSSALSIRTTVSSAVMRTSARVTATEEVEALFEVERGVDVFERHAQLHHRERDLGLDADHHRLGAPQIGHVRDRAQRPRGEGVHDVDRRDVDDDALRPEAADPVHQ